MQFRLNILTIYVEGAAGTNSCHIADQFPTMDDWKQVMFEKIHNLLANDRSLATVHYGSHSITRESALACANYDTLADQFKEIAKAIKMDRIRHEFVLSSATSSFKYHIHMLRA